MIHNPKPDSLLTPAEVAALLRVDPKTVTRWAHSGKIPAIRTPGGHRRFYYAVVLAVMQGTDPWSAKPHETHTESPTPNPTATNPTTATPTGHPANVTINPTQDLHPNTRYYLSR